MEAYTNFAKVYNLFMDNVPYEDWCNYIAERLKEYGITDASILDLGCGTGTLTRMLRDRGYQMIGVDNSMEMLDQALTAEAEESSIVYLCQDMRELGLYEPVDAVVCACDCLNYILELDDLYDVFSKVMENLKEGGIFIFDVNTGYKYECLLGDNTIAESREEGSFIWENYYDYESRINEYYLTLFIPEGEDKELFRKYEECHYQKNYDLSEIEAGLLKAGFKIEAVYDCYSKDPVREDSEKVTYIVRKE